MTTIRTIVSSGLAVMLCVSAVGCAGGRLRDMFSRNSTSDYRTLQELAEEDQKSAETKTGPQLAEEPQERPSLGQRLASMSPLKRDAQPETAADAGIDSAEKATPATGASATASADRQCRRDQGGEGPHQPVAQSDRPRS
jgi:hypothetical protein